jgi:hypothetical protein
MHTGRVELARNNDHELRRYGSFTVGVPYLGTGIGFLESTEYARLGSCAGRDVYESITIAEADLHVLAHRLGVAEHHPKRIVTALVKRARNDWLMVTPTSTPCSSPTSTVGSSCGVRPASGPPPGPRR